MGEVIPFPSAPPDECSVEGLLADLNRLHKEGKIKHLMGVLYWTDDSYSVWRSHMKSSESAYGSLLLQHRLLRDLDSGWETESEHAPS